MFTKNLFHVCMKWSCGVVLIIVLCRTVAMEKESVLRTKAMRERDETRAVLRYYRFVVVRIRFPEGVILQGTHDVSEKQYFYYTLGIFVTKVSKNPEFLSS